MRLKKEKLMSRTEHIYRTILVYCQYIGYSQTEIRNEKEIIFTDMLADMRHYADEYGIDFYRSLEQSNEYYSEEKLEDMRMKNK